MYRNNASFVSNPRTHGTYRSGNWVRGKKTTTNYLIQLEDFEMLFILL